ncbi:MAG TPA: YggT family protein [Candidatus Saccharimonadia bacterium]|nr:YggT family protein [Candidatus Saccharimonadia bacterium]
MIELVLVTFVDLFVLIFSPLLLLRVILSYFPRLHGSWFYGGLLNLTEPILAPVRRLLPQLPGVDLAPLATFFVLQGVQYLVHLLAGA